MKMKGVRKFFSCFNCFKWVICLCFITLHITLIILISKITLNFLRRQTLLYQYYVRFCISFLSIIVYFSLFLVCIKQSIRTLKNKYVSVLILNLVWIFYEYLFFIGCIIITIQTLTKIAVKMNFSHVKIWYIQCAYKVLKLICLQPIIIWRVHKNR